MDLSDLYDFIDELIIVFSESAEILFINQAALAFFDWQKNDVFGQSFFNLLKQNKSLLVFHKQFEAVFNLQNSEKEIETKFENKKIIQWKLLNKKLNHKEQNKLFVGKNITDIRQAEEKIFELDSIIAQAPGNLYWFSKDNIYLGCNEQSATVWGLPRSKLVGQNVVHLIETRLNSPNNKELSKTLMEQAKQIINTGKPMLNIEEPLFSGIDGKPRYYLANKMPLHNKAGEVYGVIGISTDITYRKELEENLRKEKDKATQASRSKSEFIANMSHDLRTPITGILGMTQDILNVVEEAELSIKKHPKKDNYLQLNKILETVRRDGQILISASDELLQLCNEILEVVRLESSKLLIDQQIELFDLKDVVQHNFELLEPVARHKRLNLSYEISEKLPKYLEGTRLYLDRILLNLISNALKFTGQGFVKVTMFLEENNKYQRNRKDKIYLKINVEDSGIGIPKDKYDLIFENFSRLTPAYEGLYKGAGLGLYTVKCYVKAMKGKISLTSEVGKGSIFTVILPFKKVNVSHEPKQIKPADNKDEKIAKVEPIKINDETFGHQHKLLIVEDNALAAMAVQVTLKRFGCQIDVAETGQQAISMASHKDYDLILMDIGLPDFSGIEVTKRIRQLIDHKKATVPIVALTGHAGNPDKCQECEVAGIQMVLNKPAQPLALEAILKEYVFRSVVVLDEPAASIEEIINWEACLSMSRDDETLAKEFLEIFAKDLKNSQEKLWQYLTENDMESLRDELHRIRGGLCYLKLPQLENAFKDFHELVKKSPQDIDALNQSYQHLCQSIDKFFAVYHSSKFE